MALRTVALTGLAMLAAAAPAQAATFTVTTTADTVGASGCTAALCTVRTAIAAANANGNAVDDVIVLPAGNYAVTAASGALTVPAGATRITIQGAGANTTAIQPPAGLRALVIGASTGVTVTGLTLNGTTIPSGAGGSVLVSSQAAATFNRVRITGGRAPQGGGIGALGAASLTIQSSLIDTNTATGTAITAAGGGLYVQGQTSATAITIQDSTIASNSARNGGGIAIENNSGQPPILRGVTLARNNARAGTPSGGAGGISSGATNARFQGSILAGNTSTFNFGPGPQDLPSNCVLASAAADDGGNVTPDVDDQCGLGGVHANPQLAAALDSSQPPALAIPANSSAVNIASCGLRTVDQRGVARPQGANCDAGAYEVDVTAPNTTITGNPLTTTGDDTPTFTFASSEGGSAFQCSVDGGPFAPCASPFTTASLAQGEHAFAVRALDVAGNVDGSPATFSFFVGERPPADAGPIVLPQPTPTPTATPAPTPVAGQSVGVRPISGTVLVKLAGAKTFEKLSPSVIANGAEVDARAGVVEITRSDGGVAKFYDGIFKLSQSRGITTLTLSEKLTGCPKAKRSLASAAAKKPKTRKLWGDGKGKFRTKGSYSAATIRGTKWLVQDTCTTTLTRVVAGVVAVEDFAKKKTVLVKKGKRYTARPRR